MRPERIVHIGLGNFFKAHQAWFTEKARDSEDWGIVAFTGRTAKATEDLRATNCTFPVVTRYPDHDEIETISSVVRAEAGSNWENLATTLASPQIALVTLTITEAGYLKSASTDLTETALGRLALALNARMKANGEPVALVSCDNLPDNASVLKNGLAQLGSLLGQDFVDYLDTLSFVSTSVDRITPAVSQADSTWIMQQTGKLEPAAVVTEPFKDWILQGDFPLGRPKWESAGAKFVEDIRPFENRKLWLLNGAHTLIALIGTSLGYRTVSEAFADPAVATVVEAWWDEACEFLPEALDLNDYRESLKSRFSNPRMSDELSRILQETFTKIQVRFIPVAIELSRIGRTSSGATAAVAGLFNLARYSLLSDARAQEISKALATSSDQETFVKLLSPELAASHTFLSELGRSIEKQNSLVTNK